MVENPNTFLWENSTRRRGDFPTVSWGNFLFGRSHTSWTPNYAVHSVAFVYKSATILDANFWRRWVSTIWPQPPAEIRARRRAGISKQIVMRFPTRMRLTFPTRTVEILNQFPLRFSTNDIWDLPRLPHPVHCASNACFKKLAWLANQMQFRK